MSNFNLKSGNTTPFKEMGSSPAKGIGLLTRGVKAAKHLYKAGKKAYTAYKKSKNTPSTKRSIKHDPDSGHLRIEETGDYIPVSGKATGKPGGLTWDPTKTHRMEPDLFPHADKITKGYTGKGGTYPKGWDK